LGTVINTEINQIGKPMDAKLVKAYEQAKYVIESDPIIELRVGSISQTLNNLMNVLGVKLMAFITPENPYSESLGVEKNEERHINFLTDLADLSIDKSLIINGYGVDDEEIWPREKSYLIPFENEDDAASISKKYGQNAHLICMYDCEVKLVFNR
jgi:hypothetical protein